MLSNRVPAWPGAKGESGPERHGRNVCLDVCFRNRAPQRGSAAAPALQLAALSQPRALTHAYDEVAKFLVEKGARVSAKDDSGETALMKACSSAAVLHKVTRDSAFSL